MGVQSQSKENLVNSTSFDSNPEEGAGTKEDLLLDELQDVVLTQVEKRFLLSAERGDCATVRRLIHEYKDKPLELNINCTDPLNRSALISAIENENIELMNLLLEEGIKVKDALLHAIKEEYVEAVETLLCWEEDNHVAGEPYSWEAVDRAASTFTPDITPLILAAHKNNYEIIKILLDRGATLPMPHDVRCGCDECVAANEVDSLCHSQSRINAYKALSASSLIALSSRDPILTAFELSWELRRLSRMETEFRAEYNVMRKNVMEFACSLLDHARTSNELEIMLNHTTDEDEPAWEPGERQTLNRLKLAIKYQQKAFVAHPNVQQLLAKIWYEGLPGFRRKGMVGQLSQVGKLAAMFPVYSMIYMLMPYSESGKFMKKPFVKFICHSASYAFFLTLLGAASQRIETLVFEWFGNEWMQEMAAEWKRKERGSLPGFIEWAVIIYVVSLCWHEIKSLFTEGLIEYINDLWNIVDCAANSAFMLWIFLRFYSIFTVYHDYQLGMNPWMPREQWSSFDPMLLSEGAFAAGMIFSFLKLVHIFSINPHLGPLQVSLGRMIIDIIKFFFIYTLVLFAFGCGLNQLLWYYADLEKDKCYHEDDHTPDFDNHEKSCAIWRRFSNLFETSQSLFWASFGLVDLMAFELQGIKGFTRFWALLMFGSYSVINIIVLLNMLIAMMSNSYQIISERADTEWKFARSKLWMSYFEDGDTLPPPFNLCPSLKIFCRWAKEKRSTLSIKKKSRDIAQKRHDTVMKLLVRRYVTAEQRKRDDYGVTEDDVMEIRQDISAMRYEMIDIYRSNGMKTPDVNKQDIAGKKGRVMERRILKDFQIGFVEGILADAAEGGAQTDIFSSIAKNIGKKSVKKQSQKKQDWNAIVRSNTIRGDPIGSQSEAVTRRKRQSLKRQIIANANAGLEMDTNDLVDLNPKLGEVQHGTRVAYVKFMAKKIKREVKFMDEELGTNSGTSTTFEHEKRTDSARSSQKSIDKVFRESIKRKMEEKEEAKVESNSIAPKKSSLKQSQPEKTETAKPEPPPAPKETVTATIEPKPSSPVPTPEPPKTPEPPSDINPALPPDASLDIHQFRTTSPIMEDPNEDASANNSRRTSASVPEKSNKLSSRQQSVDSLSSRPTTPTPESKRGSLVPTIETPEETEDDEKRPKSPRPKTPESGKLSPAAIDPTANQLNQGSPSHGKSKTSGKNLSGWF
ncbi:transient receptor potential protein [Culicoides brevitarsis]|uniref:transient receptor potential protein n=1 Tax=Culicoides brevitarsis TaxID=469753 RepID=UPI00307C7D5B